MDDNTMNENGIKYSKKEIIQKNKFIVITFTTNAPQLQILKHLKLSFHF